MTMRALLCLCAALALAAGCGGEASEDTAVEATEANTVELGGLRYRVPLFRELNPNVQPDRALYDGPPPAEGHGLYAAFLQVCNPGATTIEPTGRVALEDAFGQRFRPLPATDPDLGYRPEPLAARACLPARGTVAARTFDGAAVVFELPFDAVRERPLVLELVAGSERRRIQLDV